MDDDQNAHANRYQRVPGAGVVARSRSDRPAVPPALQERKTPLRRRVADGPQASTTIKAQCIGNTPDPGSPGWLFRGDLLQDLVEPPALSTIHPAELVGDALHSAQCRMRLTPGLDEILQGRYRRQKGPDHLGTLNHGPTLFNVTGYDWMLPPVQAPRTPSVSDALRPLTPFHRNSDLGCSPGQCVRENPGQPGPSSVQEASVADGVQTFELFRFADAVQSVAVEVGCRAPLVSGEVRY